MNLVLFTPEEISQALPRSDPRAEHLLSVLNRQAGDSFDAGVINGARGRGVLQSIQTDRLVLSFTWGSTPPQPEPTTLIVGLARPQTARDILRDATTLGVAAIHFVSTDKAERSYARSSLWTTEEWKRQLISGAAQAFSTLIPEVSCNCSLAEKLALLPAAGRRLALDNYEATGPLSALNLAHDSPVVLVLGPERGWSDADRALLRAHRFDLVHLGPRVLRCETAVIAALTLVRAARERV